MDSQTPQERGVATMKERYGADYYKRLGSKGGTKSTGRPFRDKELARKAGRLGGLKSRRTKGTQ